MLLGQYRQCQTATTYYAPTAYHQTVTANVEKILFLPVERDDPYYATIVHDKLRQEERIKGEFREQANLAAEVSKLSTSVSGLEKRLAQLLGTPVPPSSGGDSPQPAPDNGNKPVPPPPTPDTPVPPTQTPQAAELAKEVTTIFTKNCAKCHTGDTSAKNFIMFSDDGKMADFKPLEKVLIDQEIYSGKMPKSSKPLDEATYSKVRAWVDLSRADIVSALADCKKKGE